VRWKRTAEIAESAEISASSAITAVRFQPLDA